MGRKNAGDDKSVARGFGVVVPVDAGRDVGIVIPVYRGRRFLGEALASVAAQSATISRDVLVVEDGSPEGDTAADIAAAYPGVRYEYWPDNRGVFYARCYGATRLASTRYLAFLDQDDVWRPEFLTRTVEALEHRPDAPMAVANAEMRTASGAYTLYRVGTPEITLDALKWRNTITTPGQVLARRTAFDAARLEPVLSSPGADDWLLWLALLAVGGDGVYIPEVLLDYREHEGGAHNRVDMRRSERAVVSSWFPRFGLSSWDARCYGGRVALDLLREARLERQPQTALLGAVRALRDPAAFLAAVRERRRRLTYRRV